MPLNPVSLVGDARTFLSEVRAEFKKVTWPSKQEYVGGTVGVLVVVAFFAVALGLIDFGLAHAVKQLIP